MKKILTCIFSGLAVCFCGLSMIACSLDPNNPGKNEFILDNPTEKKITVSVDGTDYDLEPLSYEKLKLQAGKHTMILPGGEPVDFIVCLENNGGILNPTRSTYYKVHMGYVREGIDYDYSKYSTYGSVVIDSVEYEGPFSRVYGTVIDNKVVGWQFPIHTPFTEVEYVSSDDVSVAVRSKIFTKREFIDFFEEATETKGYYEANKVVTEEPVFVEPARDVTFMVPDFKNQDKKRHAQRLVELDEAYGNAYTEAEQREIMKEYKTVWKAYVESSLNDEYDEAEYEKMAGFTIHNLTKGVIILD